MAWIALALFFAAAVGGLIMAVRIFGDGKPPMPLALGHGLAAAAGLVLVLIVWLGGGATLSMRVGLGILVLAALGGFFLFSFQVRDKAHPKAVVALHAALAVIGVAALLYGML